MLANRLIYGARSEQPDQGTPVNLQRPLIDRTANQRLATLPDIPSAKEGGINYQMSIWAGIFAPKGTPKEIIATRPLMIPQSESGSPSWADRFRSSRREHSRLAW
jgi:tripartite-type tricarboxylate transporter receptor subunit TctC